MLKVLNKDLREAVKLLFNLYLLVQDSKYFLRIDK